MRWSPQSWRAFVTDDGESAASPTGDLGRWHDEPASLIAARVDLACRAAHAHVGAVPPTVLVGLDGTVGCWWRSPHLAPAPFHAEGPDRWTLSPQVPLTALAPMARRGCPSLQVMTTVGTTPQHQLVLVDLNHWGILGVDASEPMARCIVRALAAGLGVPPLSTPPVMWWGGVEPLDDDVDEAEREVLSDAEIALEALASSSRLPAVAVVMGDHTAGVWPAMTPAVDSGRAVVTVGRRAAGLWLTAHDGLWRLEPHQLDVMPVGIGGIDLPEVSGHTKTKEHYMSTSAESLVSVHRLTPTPNPIPISTPAPARRSAKAPERGWPLMVSVLGSPRVVDHQDQPVEFERSKALELVVWLALHRPRCTRSGARSALWDLPVRDGSFANIVCDARRRMAEAVPAPPGTEWIARSLGDELPLHPHIVTDADLLRATLRSAHGNADPGAGQQLRHMLHLVRGVPFEGTNYLWADAEGLTSELTMLIVQASAVSARRYLDTGDVAGVFEATAVGLRVVPRHEELIALRLRAHHRNGDDAGVRQEWLSYERALASDPFTSRPSTKLLALRQELLRRPVSA